MQHMDLDPELSAMNQVLEVFNYLGHEERTRVIDWVRARFHLREGEETPVEEAAPREEMPAPPKEAESVPPAAPAEPEVTTAKPAAPKIEPEAGKVFAEFETVDDLFLSSSAKKVSHRILLVAAYLQEKKNLDEISSLEINTELKRLGYGVTNITTLINGLIKKIPPPMIVTRKDGSTKQSRRKFKVTERGFDDVKKFIITEDG